MYYLIGLANHHPYTEREKHNLQCSVSHNFFNENDQQGKNEIYFPL